MPSFVMLYDKYSWQFPAHCLLCLTAERPALVALPVQVCASAVMSVARLAQQIATLESEACRLRAEKQAGQQECDALKKVKIGGRASGWFAASSAKVLQMQPFTFKRMQAQQAISDELAQLKHSSRQRISELTDASKALQAQVTECKLIIIGLPCTTCTLHFDLHFFQLNNWRWDTLVHQGCTLKAAIHSAHIRSPPPLTFEGLNQWPMGQADINSPRVSNAGQQQ